MAGTNKATANQLFGKISAYSTIVQQNLGKYLNKLSPYAKEYESTLDLVLDILRTLGYSEERLIAEILEVVAGDASIGAIVTSPGACLFLYILSIALLGMYGETEQLKKPVKIELIVTFTASSSL